MRNSPNDGAVAKLFALEVIAITGIVEGSEDAVDDSVDETTLDAALAAKQQKHIEDLTKRFICLF